MIAVLVALVLAVSGCDKPKDEPRGWTVEQAPLAAGAEVDSYFASDDCAHYAYVLRRDEKVAVVADGRQGPEFGGGGVRVHPVAFGAGGRLCYFVETRNECVLVVDQQIRDRRNLGASWYQPQFSPDRQHLAYDFYGENGSTFVVDDKPNPLSGSINNLSFRFSDRGNRYTYLAKRGDRHYVVRDGRELAAFDQVIRPEMSDDGEHIIYAGRRGEDWVVMLDDREVHVYEKAGKRPPVVRISRDGAHWACESSIVIVDGQPQPLRGDLSPGGFFGHHLAYEGWADVGYVVVIDGKPQPHKRVRLVLPDGEHMTPMFFSDDGQRMAYVAHEGDQLLVVVDGVPGPAFAAVPDMVGGERLIFSRDGKHVAGVFIRPGKEHDRVVVLDGVPGKDYDNVFGVTFSPDSRRLAYHAVRGREHFVVVDGQEHGPYREVDTPWLAFSPDSQHWAVGVQKEKIHVLMDGQEGSALGSRYQGFDMRTKPRFAPDGSLHYLGISPDQTKAIRIRCVPPG
jgi:hypothetical protein